MLRRGDRRRRNQVSSSLDRLDRVFRSERHGHAALEQARTRKSRKSSYGCVYELRRRDGTEHDGWFARFVESGRRVQRGGFLTRDAAEDFLARQRVEKSERRALDLPELQRVSVENGIKRYLDWSKEHRRLGTHESNSPYLRSRNLCAMTSASASEGFAR